MAMSSQTTTVRTRAAAVQEKNLAPPSQICGRFFVSRWVLGRSRASRGCVFLGRGVVPEGIIVVAVSRFLP